MSKSKEFLVSTITDVPAEASKLAKLLGKFSFDRLGQIPEVGENIARPVDEDAVAISTGKPGGFGKSKK